MARNIVPDSKLVFLSSHFTSDLAGECLREGALALLVKPFLVQRLAQCINSLQQEPELLDCEEFIPDSEESLRRGENIIKWTENSVFCQSPLECPFCSTKFESLHFKNWMFPVSDTESDFCPVYPKNVVPELYGICVCPYCFYANYAGRFERYFPKVNEKKAFLEDSKVQHRREFVGNLKFSGQRGFQEGLKSFDLAGLVCAELPCADWDIFYGELLLKASWLCRRMGRTLQEKEAQIMALKRYIELYRPYLRRNGAFPRKGEIISRLPRGKNLLRERTVIVAGFLTAELSRRLSLFEQSSFYFGEVLKLPILPSYPFLLQHVKKACSLLPETQRPD
ncbi:MAG: DUF2225 domain-containing protein [Candidatus Ozemobacteraceae bacterium]